MTNTLFRCDNNPEKIVNILDFHILVSEINNSINYVKNIIKTTNSPAPIGPYSQAVKIGNTLYTSGQIAINPKQEIEMDSIEIETHQVMKNMEAVLNDANMTFDNVVKTSIFILNMDNFSQINEIYGQYFTSNFPARETVEVARLPKDVNLEISMIAIKD
ncbi:MAG: reactive intermediate/imine deaminase [Cryomorphaceae bacterium]|nr:MAG: reactive intermediate/imine deaminase [Cryomorphaceae bacterium]